MAYNEGPLNPVNEERLKFGASPLHFLLPHCVQAGKINGQRINALLIWILVPNVQLPI